VKIGGYNIANVYKPPAEPREDTNPLPFQPHPAIYMADFNSHHPDWGYDTPNNDGNMQLVWASCSDLALVHGRGVHGDGEGGNPAESAGVGMNVAGIPRE